MSLKLGIPKDSLYNKYGASFNVALKNYFEMLQGEIQIKGMEDPSVLKADPVWVEKLKTPDGFQEYLDRFEVDIKPDNFYKFPEINKMIMDIRPEDFPLNFSEMFLAGIVNEDKMRLEPHAYAMKEYLPVFDEQLEETRTINNEMWVTKLKEDTLNYIKTVLDPEWQKLSTSYAKTDDNMRVDVGLVISRDPIFLR